MFYLLDVERMIRTGLPHYWKKNRFGYTTNLKEAGLFPEFEAKGAVKSDRDNRTIMIAEETVKGILR